MSRLWNATGLAGVPVTRRPTPPPRNVVSKLHKRATHGKRFISQTPDHLIDILVGTHVIHLNVTKNIFRYMNVEKKICWSTACPCAPDVLGSRQQSLYIKDTDEFMHAWKVVGDISTYVCDRAKRSTPIDIQNQRDWAEKCRRLQQLHKETAQGSVDFKDGCSLLRNSFVEDYDIEFTQKYGPTFANEDAVIFSDVYDYFTFGDSYTSCRGFIMSPGTSFVLWCSHPQTSMVTVIFCKAYAHAPVSSKIFVSEHSRHSFDLSGNKFVSRRYDNTFVIMNEESGEITHEFTDDEGVGNSLNNKDAILRIKREMILESLKASARLPELIL